MIETSVEAAIGTITLNRPQQLNALAGTMREDLLAAIRRLTDDAAVRVLIVTGAGKGFCAGGDLQRLTELRTAQDGEGLGRLLDLGQEVVLALRACPKPILASINGAAAGAGLALALACDLRIAAETAVFSSAFVKIGLVPDWGTSWLLTRAVGASRALEMALSGRRVDAAEAASIGLVHRVVPAERLAEDTRLWAEELAKLPALALAGIKNLIDRASTATLGNQLQAERQTQLQCFQSPELPGLLEQATKPREKRPQTSSS